MPDTTPPLPSKAALDAETDRGLAWTREGRKRLSADDPEDSLHLRASMRLVEVLRVEFPDLAMGRVLMSAADGLAAIEEHLGEQDFDVATGLLSVLSLAAEQLAREEAEAGHA